MGSCKIHTSRITKAAKKMKNVKDVEESKNTHISKFISTLEKFKTEHQDNKSKQAEAFRVLITALKNIVKNPHEPRYRRIPCNNLSIRTKLTDLNLGKELLLLTGFCLVEEESPWWSYPTNNDHIALWCLSSLEECYDAECLEKKEAAKSEGDTYNQPQQKHQESSKISTNASRFVNTRLKGKSQLSDEKVKEREHLLFLLEQDRLEREAELKYTVTTATEIISPLASQKHGGTFVTLTDLVSSTTENEESKAFLKKDNENMASKGVLSAHSSSITTSNRNTIRTLYDDVSSSATMGSAVNNPMSDPREQHQKAVREVVSKFKEERYTMGAREYKVSTPSTANIIALGTAVETVTPGSVVLEVTGKPVKRLAGITTGTTPVVQVSVKCEETSATINPKEKKRNKKRETNELNDSHDKSAGEHKNGEGDEEVQCEDNTEYNKQMTSENEIDDELLDEDNTEKTSEAKVNRLDSFPKRPFMLVNSQLPCLYTLKKMHNERQDRKLSKSFSTVSEETSEDKKNVDSCEATLVSSETKCNSENKKNVVIHHSKAIINAEEMVAPYWVSKIRIRKIETPNPLPVESTNGTNESS